MTPAHASFRRQALAVSVCSLKDVSLSTILDPCFFAEQSSGMATQSHQSHHQKRPHGSPTGETPYSASKKRISRAKYSKARRNLTYESVDSNQKSMSRYKALHDWSTEEVKALVEFVLLNSTGETWPATKTMNSGMQLPILYSIGVIFVSRGLVCMTKLFVYIIETTRMNVK